MKTQRNYRCVNQWNRCDKSAPRRSPIYTNTMTHIAECQILQSCEHRSAQRRPQDTTKTKSSQCRMSESVELCTQIDCQSTIRKSRISESIELSTQIDRGCVIKACRIECRLSESVELCTQINFQSTTRNCRISESIELSTQIDRGCVIKECRISESVELLLKTDGRHEVL